MHQLVHICVIISSFIEMILMILGLTQRMLIPNILMDIKNHTAKESKLSKETSATVITAILVIAIMGPLLQSPKLQ